MERKGKTLGITNDMSIQVQTHRSSTSEEGDLRTALVAWQDTGCTVKLLQKNDKKYTALATTGQPVARGETAHIRLTTPHAITPPGHVCAT